MAKSHWHEIHTTVKGGFPVIFRAELCPAEPDVGFRNEYIGDYEVLTESRQSATFLNLKESEITALCDKMLEVVCQE